MKNAQQHACEACGEFVETIHALKHRLAAAKRLPAGEMAAELCAIQVEFGAFEQQAREFKTWVTVALTTAGVKEAPTLAEVRARVGREEEAGNRDGCATGRAEVPALLSEEASEDAGATERHVGMFPEE